jgi:hypothetical protein
MTDGRSCACGCGERLPNGRRNRRFVSNAQRMRAQRAEAAVNEQGATGVAADDVPARRV